jgi:hypothetical protein
VPFKKQSIFFRCLLYWQELEIGHAIDTMHIMKGVFESIISTLLDIPGKTKDVLRACKDLQKLEIRSQLHPQERPNGKYYLPPPPRLAITRHLRRKRNSVGAYEG